MLFYSSEFDLEIFKGFAIEFFSMEEREENDVLEESEEEEKDPFI